VKYAFWQQLQNRPNKNSTKIQKQYLEIASGSKSFVADATNMWSNAGVDPHMRRQMSRLDKCLSTLIAVERSLACMMTHVGPQAASL